MKRTGRLVLLLVMLVLPARSFAEVYFFPYMAEYTLADGARSTAPEYIFPLVGTAQHAVRGNVVDDHFFAYTYEGDGGDSLGMMYANGAAAYADAQQLAVESLYGYRLTLDSAALGDLVSVSTFESGVRLQPYAFTGISEVFFVAGDVFSLQIHALDAEGGLISCMLDMDFLALDVGADTRAQAEFLSEGGVRTAHEVQVTKLVHLR